MSEPTQREIARKLTEAFSKMSAKEQTRIKEFAFEQYMLRLARQVAP